MGTKNNPKNRTKVIKKREYNGKEIEPIYEEISFLRLENSNLRNTIIQLNFTSVKNQALYEEESADFREIV
jgi:hypothetical protein